jgi:glycosyltransferase involved in cell wall biosynthesis
MSRRWPLVSVVIPAYNAARWIRDAIQSVVAQDWQDLEIVVVDDGSTDSTPEIVRSFGNNLILLRQPNRGVAHARNLGTQTARGRYVAYLDADDTWHSDKLTRQLTALRAANHAHFCSTPFVLADDTLRPLAIRDVGIRDPLLGDLLFQNVVGTPSTVICERELVLSVCGFREELSQCADWDLWLRLRSRTPFLCLAEPLATYRIHLGSMSSSPQLLEKDTLALLTRTFADPALPVNLQALRRRSLAWNYRVLSANYHQSGQRTAALRCLLTAILYHWRTPFSRTPPSVRAE